MKTVLPVEVGLIVNKYLAGLGNQPYLLQISAMCGTTSGSGRWYFCLLILNFGPGQVLDWFALEEDLARKVRVIAYRRRIWTHHPAL